MCLAVPSKIIEKDGFVATVDVLGARREVNLMLMPEDVDVGDYVLVHAGFAMQKVSRESAEQARGFVRTLVDDLLEDDARRASARQDANPEGA